MTRNLKRLAKKSQKLGRRMPDPDYNVINQKQLRRGKGIDYSANSPQSRLTYLDQKTFNLVSEDVKITNVNIPR